MMMFELDTKQEVVRLSVHELMERVERHVEARGGIKHGITHASEVADVIWWVVQEMLQEQANVRNALKK